jgi:capsular exopolysaccharide synthesis family protein
MKDISPYFIKQTITPPEEEPILLSESTAVEQEEPGLRDYWRLIGRHRWLVLALTLATLLATALFIFTRTPIYTAETTILIDRRPYPVIKFRDATSESLYWDQFDQGEYQKTQHEILKSRALAARVIQDEGLENHSLFVSEKKKQEAKRGLVAGLWADVKGWAGELLSPTSKTKTDGTEPTQVKPGLIGAYLSMLDIKPVRGTSLVKVSFSTPDPPLSARLADTHANAYARYGLDLKSRANEEALSFLEAKLLELKERVEKSEVALNSFRRDKGIIALNDKENILVERLVDFNKRLTEAEAERIAHEAQIQLIRNGNHEAIPTVIKSPFIQSLKGQLMRLEGEYVKLSKEFKPGYPLLDNVIAQIEETRSRLTREIQTEVKGIESAYQAALTKEKDLRAKMVEEKKATLGQKDSAVEYVVLAREVETNRQLYDSVLQRMKEMQVAAEIRKSNVHVIDKAERPAAPSYPKKKRSLLLGLIIGLALGVGLAFFLDHLDNTLKSPEEVVRYLHLPNLGVLPDLLKLNARAYAPKSLGHRIQITDGQAGKEIVPANDPLSVAAEAYRTFRTTILLSRAGEPPQTLLITSATRGDGKTTIVVNTAITFAQMGVKVLIMDCDLRRPSCHKVLGMENGVGLSEALAGQIEIQKIIKPTTTDNVFFVSSGSAAPNPAELLGSRRMYETLNSLRERYDFIFLDSSPIMAVSDGVLLSAMVDGVLLVVDTQKNPKQMVREARARLSSARSKILGVVLNRVDMRKGGYGYYHYYYPYYENDEDESEERK